MASYTEKQRQAALTEALQKIPPHCQRAECTRPPTYWYQGHPQYGNHVHFYCTECHDWFDSHNLPKWEIGEYGKL